MTDARYYILNPKKKFFNSAEYLNYPRLSDLMFQETNKLLYA